MTIRNDATMIIFTSEELKTVLEQNNSYTHIHFRTNITLASGIKIASTKTNIIIDGTYQDIRYTYEDMKNISASNTINITSSKMVYLVII